MSLPRPEALRAARILTGDYLAIRPGESVIISADTATEPEAIEALFQSLKEAGARPALLKIERLPYQGLLADPYLTEAFGAAVRSCDAWIDLCFPYVAGSSVHDAAMKAKRTKYLLGGDLGAEGMIRMFGRADLDLLHAVQLAFDEVVIEGLDQDWRVTSAAGTDIAFRLDRNVKKRPRRAEKPGSYGIPGSAVLYTDIESVKGKLVLEAVFHEYFTFLPEPLALVVDGRIRELSGGGAERSVMDRALRRAGGGEYGNVIHLTYGFNPGARADARSLSEATRVKGNNSVGLGRPFWLPGGGENHPDGIVSRQSIWVGKRQVVDDGRLVAPAKLAGLASQLRLL